ncbi:hypothetical protein OIE66_15370 [Nonomuraea sp. NBC_01738]|uniref:hypothetical protein n=1 Tax=Nonomuraea sp. NBC_01738 TaxID=2976003 RepID=UPI002E1282C1|nr:hypothetical protein OIE66_15370 [Nonomuraea sp. NBC_01738]
MTWIIVAIVMALAGTGVLVAAGIKVLAAARGLSREIAQTKAEVEPRVDLLRARNAVKAPGEG